MFGRAQGVLLSTIFAVFMGGCFGASIDFLTCGNGLVEPSIDEDCDVAVDVSLGTNLECGPSDDRVRGCKYVCGPGGPDCPRGWQCNAAGVCAYASGAFDAQSAAALEAPAAAVGLADFDGDGRDDLLSVTRVAFSIRFSSEAGFSSEDVTFAFPFSSQFPTAIGDINGDGIADAAGPVGDGILVFLGSRDRNAGGVAGHPIVSELPLDRRLYPASTPDTGRWSYVTLDAAEGSLCLRPLSDTECSEASTVVVPMGLDGSDHVVLVQEVEGLLIVAVQGDTMMHIFRTPLPTQTEYVGGISLPAPFSGGLWLVDVDGDGLDDLLANSAEGPVVAHGAVAGSFEAAVVAALPESESSPPRAILAAEDFNEDGLADYVVGAGVFLRTTDGGFRSIFDTSFDGLFTFTEAAVGDFNGDGRPDIVGTSDSTSVEVLMNAGPGPFGDWALWSGADFLTTVPPRDLAVADFDGDLVDDLAFVLDDYRGDASLGQAASIAVVYGEGAGTPTRPLGVGRYDGVVSLRTFNDQLGFNRDAQEELMVEQVEVDESGNESRSYTVLRSGGPRIQGLGSLLRPRSVDAPQATGLSLGTILLPSATGDSFLPPTLFNLRSTGPAFLMPGRANARFPHSAMVPIDLAALCGTVEIDPACLTGEAGDFGGQGPDRAVAALLVDRCDGAVMAIFEAESGYACRSASPLPSKFAPFLRNRAPRLSSDFNRNGWPDLIYFLDDAEQPVDAVIVWDLRFPDFETTTEIVIEDARLIDMLALDADADQDLELLVLTEEDLRMGEVSARGGFRPASDGVVADFSPSGIPFTDATRMVSGDMNGDGFSDVVINDGGRIIQMFGRPIR